MRWRQTGLVVAAVLLAWMVGARAGAAPGAGLLAAVKAARCRLVYLHAHISDYGKLAPEEAIRASSPTPYEAHLRLVSAGQPLAPAELRKATWAMCEAIEGLGAQDLQHLIIDVYADDRLARPTSDSGANPGVFDMDPGFRGEAQRYTLSERFVDTSRPCNWYARVLWWRPWRSKDRRLIGMEPWQFDAWYAEGNATPRPKAGGADFAPTKIK